jgi:hypothetical protein
VPKPSWLKKVFFGIGVIFLFILIVLLGLLAFLGSGKEEAMRKADQFCKAAAKVQNIDALEQLAKSENPAFKVDRASAVQAFTFPGAIFEAARCTVQLESGKVSTTAVDYISR